MIRRTCVCVFLAVLMSPVASFANDPLPSWNEGATKAAILGFVKKVTTEGSPDFVAVPDRIATFDNDGTLWVEKPMYAQAAFLIDRVRVLAPSHPEWKTTEPFRSVLAGDMAGVIAGGAPASAKLVAETHAGMTDTDFQKIATDWITTAKHAQLNRHYTELVYQPMLELLAYLRANGFRTYIVSGGGVDFLRPWTERVYGIPPEQVIGSEIKIEYVLNEHDEPELRRLPAIDFVDDHAGKPVKIQKTIGKRPIMAFGNSDGDYEMLRWTTAGPGPRFGLIVHHTDAEREYAYDKDSPVGRLIKALEEAPKRGWVVVDMKSDWRTIFAPVTKQ